jgi:non-homologous end joining protein Ku
LPGPRKYVGDFQITVGPISLLGSLIGVRKTGSDDDNKFVSVCPDCPAPVKPKQGYTCENGHGPYGIADLLKAKMLDDNDKTLVFVSPDDVKDARRSDLPVNVMQCTVHSAADIEAATFPSDTAYVFTPRNRDDYYNLLVDLAANSDKAFVAQCNVRNHEGFYRLVEWRGSLCIQRLYWPYEVNEFDRYVVGADKAVYNAGYAMIERIETDFDPDTYVATTAAKLAALSPTGARPAAPATAPRPTVNSKDDLLAALSAFGETKPKKKGKKSA